LRQTKACDVGTPSGGREIQTVSTYSGDALAPNSKLILPWLLATSCLKCSASEGSTAVCRTNNLDQFGKPRRMHVEAEHFPRPSFDSGSPRAPNVASLEAFRGLHLLKFAVNLVRMSMDIFSCGMATCTSLSILQACTTCRELRVGNRDR